MSKLYQKVVDSYASFFKKANFIAWSNVY